jgi:hypothetical protein
MELGISQKSKLNKLLSHFFWESEKAEVNPSEYIYPSSAFYGIEKIKNQKIHY